MLLERIATESPHLSWIKDNTILLVRHGSHAYGTNIASSDEDFKGITIPTKKYYFGTLNRFEQAELKAPDTVIFELTKFLKLAAENNPNCLEVLFVDEKHHISISPLGKKLLSHRDKFLSKKIKFTFSGYARAQLHRIKLHRTYLQNPVNEPPTRESVGLNEKPEIQKEQLNAALSEVDKELNRFNLDFWENMTEDQKIEIRETLHHVLADLKISSDDRWNASARKVGFSENFIFNLQKEREYSKKQKEYTSYQEWKKTRNKDRFALEAAFGYDTKHAMHLVRLMRSCKEALSTGVLNVFRPDHKELIEIRNGAFKYDDLISYVEEEEKDIDELYKTSKLPHSPDRKFIDELSTELIEEMLWKK